MKGGFQEFNHELFLHEEAAAIRKFNAKFLPS
jgi:hypothetical protein